MQSNHPVFCLSQISAAKQCRKCGQTKPLGFFPCDHSRPNGRWHTCKLCNQQHGRLVRKAARDRKALALRSLPPPPCRRLDVLEAQRGRRGGTVFEQLSPYLQQQARRICHKSLRTHVQRYGFRASQPKSALLWASAVSNAQRVGDSSWSRRMRRLKGWRRQRQRDFVQQVQLAEMRARNAASRKAACTGVGWTPESRLAGI